jgi:hypothetical protein
MMEITTVAQARRALRGMNIRGKRAWQFVNYGTVDPWVDGGRYQASASLFLDNSWMADSVVIVKHRDKTRCLTALVAAARAVQEAEGKP